VRKFPLIPLAIVLVVALIFGGCKPAVEVPEEIRVGCSTALTGMYSGFCVGGAFGSQAAVDDINELGGVYVEEYGKKLPVRLILADMESDPVKGGTLAEDLIVRDKVHFLTQGGGPQPMITPIMNVTDRYDVVFCGVDGLKEQYFVLREDAKPGWKYVWNIAFAVGMPYPPGSFWDKPGYTAADTTMLYLNEIFDRTNGRVGLFATDDVDGRGWYEGITPAIEATGFTIAGREQDLGIFPMGTTDFSSLINEWRDFDVELLMGNAPAPDCGTILRQCREMGFHPKAIWATRGAIFHQDIIAWGGDLPYGVVTDGLWSQNYDPVLCPGIGGTTPMSLHERWVATGNQFSPSVGFGYGSGQVLFDAIERAGTLETEAVSRAIGDTDLPTVLGPMLFDKETQFAGFAFMLVQWRKVDKPWVWENPAIYALQEFQGPTAEMLFPIPYD